MFTYAVDNRSGHYIRRLRVSMHQYLYDNSEIIEKRALQFFPGLRYDEIFRCVNLDTLKVRRYSLCQKYFDMIKVARKD